MTLSSTTTKVSYAGDGSTTAFTVTFPFQANSDIRAILRDSAGAETVWVEGTQYTLTGAGASTGTLTAKTSPTDYTPASDETLVIKRAVPEIQGTDIPIGGAFPASSVENALDKLTMQVQAHTEEIARCLRVPETDTATDLEFAIDSTRATKAMGFDANGDAVVSTETLADIEGQITVSAASESAASTSETNASSAQTAAETAQTAAETAQTAAETAETNAETAETNAETAETNAAASESAASTSETNASSSASAASTSETNASASETAAAASAAKLTGTSTTSLAIGTGEKIFTTQSGKFFDAGYWLLITSDADPTNYMHGQVTTYSGTTLTMNITNVGGSGTLADWTIRVAGTRGTTGPAGGGWLIWLTT